MAYTASDSFTVIGRVESYAGYGALSASTVPTSQEALDFMALRAGTIEQIMLAKGVTYTVPTGTNPITATSSLGKMADQINAVWAAIDVISAHEVGHAPAQSQKVIDLQAIISELLEQFDKVLDSSASTLGNAAVASDVGTGGVTAATFPPASSATQTRGSLNDWDTTTKRW